jgi:hypothetical protein
MLTLLLGALGAAAVARARGGRLEALADTRLRYAPLLVAGLSLQVLFAAWSPDWLTDQAELAIVLWSNLAVVLFIALNRELPGMSLMALGLALNVFVIASNGAMPVSERASDLAGIPSAPGSAALKHELLGPDTKLPWLGDVIPLPRLGEVLSVGDVVLIAGTIRLIYARMTSPEKSLRAPEASG